MSVLTPSSSLLELFRSHGLELKREGKSYKTCCPFHNDKSPSLLIDPEKGLWNCFGCEAGGDAITFLEKMEGLDFGQAADKWKKLSGQEPHHIKVRASVSKVIQITAEDLNIFARLQEIYAESLAQSQSAQSFLQARGLTDGETIRAFGLGFVSGTALPQMNPEQVGRLQDLGVLNNRGNESLYNCIVCPLYNREGQVVSFWGRRIVKGENPHRALPQNSESLNAVINRPAVKSQQLILVEGFLDALAAFQAGLRNVLPVGTAQPRPELVKLIHQEGVKEVLLALDPDEAGDEGAKRWAKELEARGITAKRVRLPQDPSAYFSCRGQGVESAAAESFRSHIVEQSPQLAPSPSLGRYAVGDSVPSHSGSRDSEYILDSNDLLYRVRTLGTRPTPDKLKAQILVTAGERTHRDILNLYIHKSRKTFANAVANAFREIHPDLISARVEADLERIILALEERNRQKNEATETRESPTISPDEKAVAIKYLTEPGLIDRLQDDMNALGYVGEEEAKLLVYLIATSRKLPRPLSGIISSGSGAGKSFLAELAEQLTPPEDVELFSKLSAQALYYLPKDYLYRKLLILEERAGGEGADYAIRTLQSKDRLTQMVTLKDSDSGKMAAKNFEVVGPIAYLETTTQSYLNSENTSRCFEIPLDESAEQTRRIHEHQRRSRSFDGLKLKVAKDEICRRHHNAQRLLEEVRVVIPYAEKLTFPARYLRTRRDHERFLSLIEVVTFLHQFQRVLRTANHRGKEVKYVEATVEDYAIAYRLALRVLWVSLDELSRFGRELIDSCRGQVEDMVSCNPSLSANDINWTRRQLREHLGWPDKRLRACLEELVSLEYLQILGGSKGKTFHYRLNPNFNHNAKALGLLTPEQLEARISSG